MKGRTTRIVSARIPDELYSQIQMRAGKKGVSVNAWILWAFMDALRDRHKQPR